LSYVGEGGGDLIHGSVLYGTLGQPIFTFDQNLDFVNITGLTFDGPVGGRIGTKGIAAIEGRWIYNSIIRDNYFSTHLAEAIYAPMQSTRIERNHFGTAGDIPSWPHRHIYSVPPSSSTGAQVTNQNWIAYNQFFHATGPESIRFEQGAQLHIVGNQFELNDAEATLQINGMFHVVIEGNYFEANAGDALMHFANSSDNQIGNYIVRLENNFYNVERKCTPDSKPRCEQTIHNNFIFLVDSGATEVHMGYETGTAFKHASDGTRTELTSEALFKEPTACYLTIRGPIQLKGYDGNQTQGNGNPKCHNAP
jgi:hypothetical protein